MSDHFHTYCGLLFRAAHNDLQALAEAHDLVDDSRIHARLMMRGATSVLIDLQAVVLCELMRSSRDHVRVTPDTMPLLQNPVVRELFPRVDKLCQQSPTQMHTR